jgi:hypothetical protein
MVPKGEATVVVAEVLPIAVAAEEEAVVARAAR